MKVEIISMSNNKIVHQGVNYVFGQIIVKTPTHKVKDKQKYSSYTMHVPVREDGHICHVAPFNFQ